MNIDKDIEIVKEVQGMFEHLKNHGWVNDLKREVDIDKVIPAIENVLSELEKKDIEIEILKRQVDVDNTILEKQDKELETYKKMTEKLAGYIEETGIMQKSTPLDKSCIYSPRTVVAATKQDIIDWAKREVENES